MASFIFIYTPLFYAMEHPDKIRLRIFYYALEETPDDVMTRFMSHLLYKFDNISISTDDLQSIREGKILDERILNLLQSEKYKRCLDFFDSHIEFSESQNPTGVWKECEEYALKHGKIHTRPIQIKDALGNEKTINRFDWYEQDDPEEYKIIFYDHVSLTQTERGLTLKQSIDKLSEYFVILRNKYNYSPVVVQQQAFVGEGLDAIKEKQLRPTLANLSDSKYPSRDCNVALGLFSPYKFELKSYGGYDITRLKDSCRFLEVLANRGGIMGGIIGLEFNGESCYFKELPHPSDTQQINAVYDRIRLTNENIGRTFFTFASLIKKRSKKFKLRRIK